MPRSPTIDPLSAQNAHSVARGLGWFSIGLGLAEVLAPRALTRGLGMEGHEQIVRAYGVREIATGIGILSSTHPAPWIWGRVGGDALDIATLATGLQQDNPKKENVELALVAVAGVTALDVVCGASLARHSLRVIRVRSCVAAVRRSTIIAGPASPNRLSRCGERHETSRFPATCAPRRRCGLSLLIEHLPTSLVIEDAMRVVECLQADRGKIGEACNQVLVSQGQ